MKLYTERILILLLLLSSVNLSAQLKGQARIDSLIKELPAQKEDTTKVKILYTLSYLINSIDPDEGIKYGQKALDLATSLNYKDGIAFSNTELGVNYDSKGDLLKAMEYYTKALKIFEEIGDKHGISLVIGDIGIIYKRQGNYSKALECQIKSLKLDEELGNKNAIAISASNISNIYIAQLDFKNAFEYAFLSLKIFKEEGANYRVATVYEKIGAMYCDGMHDYPKALENFLSALVVYEQLGEKQNLASVLGNIANVYRSEKLYALAISYMESSTVVAREAGYTSQVAYNLSNIGTTYLSIVQDPSSKSNSENQKSYLANVNELSKYRHEVKIPVGRAALLDGAAHYIHTAIDLFNEMEEIESVAECYRDLSDVYKLKGNYKSSMDAIVTYHTIKDSLFSKENDRMILEQGMNYKFEKKEAVAKVQQEKKDEIAARELQKQKLVRNGFMGGFAVVLLFAGIFFSQRNKIKAGKKQSDELLLNILPAEVAEELKAKGSAEAKLIDEVTVLFTDFKGFTQLSEKLSPKELVQEINGCFSAFDHIMQKHGIEKIKTIGDAYMAAGGLPTANATHPVDVVKAALDIQQYMQDHKTAKEAAGELFFEIRIGVHTGPVVAGIVGVKKFQYDIWGDTVNTASRMESSGQVGKVNISGTTYELVKDKFKCEYRGEIDAKGKGVMKMYFVG